MNILYLNGNGVVESNEIEKKRMSRKARKAFLVLIGPTVACVGLCVICPVSNTLFVRPILANFDSRYVSSGQETPIPFNRDLWMAGKACHRMGMAKFLIEKKLLEGKTRTELVEMLGEPDIDKPGDEGLRWLLGFYAKGLFDETVWLVLSIDKDDKATGSGIWWDWYDPRRP